jgi:hypothetical protein
LPLIVLGDGDLAAAEHLDHPTAIGRSCRPPT